VINYTVWITPAPYDMLIKVTIGIEPNDP